VIQGVLPLCNGAQYPVGAEFIVFPSVESVNERLSGSPAHIVAIEGLKAKV
jgi:hypothetical protein